MILIHSSDLHLDSPLTSRLSSDKVRTRKRELIDSFKRTVELAKREGARGYIIAGDLFDAEKASKDTVENFLYTVRQSPEITFFYLYGNHEKSLLSESGAEIPENLKMFSEDWTYYSLDGVTIAGRGETSKDMFDALKLSPESKNIVVLHGELSDSSDIGGKIGKKELESINADYVALGHYHSYTEEKISALTTAVYSGTPEGRGFDEAGEKGIVLIDVSGEQIKHKFQKTSKRTLWIIDADITNCIRHLEIEDRVREAIDKIPSSDIIRVRLEGERDVLDKPNTDALIEKFAREFFYFEVKDCTRVKISAEDFKNDRSLKGEFIRSVFADESLTDDEKEKIIQTGLCALLGEEIE